jgi:hypothetical protein
LKTATNSDENLTRLRADRKYQSTTWRKLFEQSWRHGLACGRHGNGIEWRVLWPAECAIAMAHEGNISKAMEPISRIDTQSRHALYGVNRTSQAAQERGDVPRSCTYFQDVVSARELESFQRQRNDVWLRDRLVVPNG